MQFTTDRLIYGGDYNPEQWMDCKDTIWPQDMEFAAKAHLNSLSVGIFSWSWLEPEDGVYDFSWLDEVMDNLAAKNMSAVLATPSGARPPWLAEKYPSVLRMNEYRQRRFFGERHNACMSSEDYIRKVTQIDAELAKRYANHPALRLWHLSNEYNNDCHCPLCQKRFQEWLEERYGNLENLNRCWWNSFWSHRYTSFSQIESPSPIGENANPALQLAWQRFSTDNMIRFMKKEIEALRQYTPNVPITTNMMGTFPGLDYFAVGRELDVSSWDNYPDWRGDERDLIASDIAAFKHNLMRGVCGQKPFLMMESSPSAVNWHTLNSLREPGTVMYQGLEAVALGSDSVQYFQFRAGRGGSEQYHGAVIDRTGTNTTRVYREVEETGRVLSSLSEVAGTRTRNKVALLYDWNCRWALDNANMLHRNNQKYEETVLSFHNAMNVIGYGVDIIDELSTEPPYAQNLSEYDMLILPMMYMIRGNFVDRIRTFVENGGIAIVTYVSGYVNEELRTWMDADPSGLEKITGVHVDECDAIDEKVQQEILWEDRIYPVQEIAELATPTTATSLGIYTQRFYAGQAAVTVNTVGKGSCYWLGGRTDEQFLQDILKKITRKAGMQPLAWDLSEGMRASERWKEDGSARYLFLRNAAHSTGTCEITGETVDVLNGTVESGVVTVPSMSIRVLRETLKDQSQE